MKFILTATLIFFFSTLMGQDLCKGFVVTTDKDTLYSYFNLNYNKPGKKTKLSVGSSWLTFYVPNQNKEFHFYGDKIEYFEYSFEGIKHIYYTVPVPSVGKKTLPYFGELKLEGQFQLLEVNYSGGGGGSFSNNHGGTSPSVYRSNSKGQYTYYYLRNNKNEFIMVKRIVKNRSRGKFSFDCPKVEERILNKYYKKSNRNDIAKDLNELCSN